LRTEPTLENVSYLRTKRAKLGHMLESGVSRTLSDGVS
jgi:hypothetical protein